MRIVRPSDKIYARVLRSLDRRAVPDPSVKRPSAHRREVQKLGDPALLRLTEKFGGPKLTRAQIRIPLRELSALGADSTRPPAAPSKPPTATSPPLPGKACAADGRPATDKAPAPASASTPSGGSAFMCRGAPHRSSPRPS
jgi:hypothetical protein